MSDHFFYRANDDLAAALRSTATAREKFWAAVIEPYESEYPKNPPIWTRFSGTSTCRGFADDAPDLDPPEGLSRAKTRTYLIPARGKAGDVWRDRVDRFNGVPQSASVFKRFGIDSVFGPGVLYSPNWMDLARVDGPVVVYVGAEFDPIPAALEPMKRSEFYAMHEKALAAVSSDGGTEATD